MLFTDSLGFCSSTKWNTNSCLHFLHSTTQRNDCLTTVRTHSETVCLFASAASVIACKSSLVKRTGTILPLASPFGSLGRPTFLAFFCCSKVPELLHNGHFYCVLC